MTGPSPDISAPDLKIPRGSPR
jgi:hypothetical protein